MNKRLLLSFLVNAALLLAVCIAPASALPVSASLSVAGSTAQPTTLPISSPQSLATDNSYANLDEAQVSFLLACRCSPQQLPQ